MYRKMEGKSMVIQGVLRLIHNCNFKIKKEVGSIPTHYHA